MPQSLKAGPEGAPYREPFMQEAAIMAQFNHEHVLKLLGVVTV